jgi:hypothetical protein
MYVAAIMADISSDWSKWEWDEPQGRWYTYRLKADRTYEYKYQYSNAAGDQSQTPRTADTVIYAGTQNTQGSLAGPYQTADTWYPGYSDNERDATPILSFSSTAPSNNVYYSSTVASSSRDVSQNLPPPTTTGMTGGTSNRYTNPSTYSPTFRPPEYTYASSTAASSSVDSTAHSFGRMTLAPPSAQPTWPTQGAVSCIVIGEFDAE